MTPDEKWAARLERAFPGEPKSEQERLAKAWKEHGLPLPDPEQPSARAKCLMRYEMQYQPGTYRIGREEITVKRGSDQ